MSLDHTHDPDLISWVESARDHADFPVQNLPFGVMDFGEGPRPVVAIGEEAFDLKVATQRGLLGECGELACAAAAPKPERTRQFGGRCSPRTPSPHFRASDGFGSVAARRQSSSNRSASSTG